MISTFLTTLRRYILSPISIFIVCITLVVLGFVQLNKNQIVTTNQLITPQKTIEWGIVDSRAEFEDAKEISHENIFEAWDEKGIARMKTRLDTISKLNRSAIVTVEPWPATEQGFLYNKILEGNYDANIKEICTIFDSQPRPVKFRFAHEMDLIGTSRYPWTDNDHNTFKLMFRYVVNLCRKQTKNIQTVWAPGGRDVGFTRYYPGDEFVDIIGFSVFSYEDFELKMAKKTFSFVDLFDSKYNAVKEFQKPVMIAEMGVSGSPEYRKQWIETALKRIKSADYQRYLKYVVYLNEKDEFPWIPDLPIPPDFSISPKEFPNI
jgi:endoglucanase